jgi:glycosyltransferase involved in cell wall biosynthesis
MRIMMVTPRFLPEMGGIETHVFEVSRRLHQLGHRVEVLTTDRSGKLPEREVMRGVGIRRVSAWPRERDYFIAPAVYDAVATSDTDVVHIQGYHTFVPPIAMTAAIRRRIPFVITFHSGGHSSRVRRALRASQRQLLRPLINRASRCIGVSQFEAEFFSQRLGLGKDRFQVISNGTHQFDNRDTANVTVDPDLIVSVGRLERYKGHHRVIQALPIIRRFLPRTKLRILGRGPYEAELRQLVSRLRLENCVEIGSVPPNERSELARRVKEAALVTLLSDYEAHPLAVMEALSLGRPVLATKCSGHLELIAKRLIDGVDVDAPSPKLAGVMIKLLQRRILAPVPALPSWEDCAQSLSDVYQQAIVSS